MMKNFIKVISIMSMLVLGMFSQSYALIGMPDNTLGCDAVVPFVCDISGTTGLNTLIVFTDVGLQNGIDFHYTINNVRSVTLYNDYMKGTKGDIVATDAFNEIKKMAPMSRKELEVDIDNDGINDHYAGYIYYDNNTITNSVVGQFFFVNLKNGIAAASNIAMKEYKDNLPTIDIQNQMAPNGIEVFTPNALASAINLQNGNTNSVTAKTFGLYERHYIADEDAATWLLFWTSENDVINTIHIDFYDNAENYASSNLTITDELTIINLEDYLPASLYPTYAKEGWIDMYWNDASDIQDLEILGWTYLQAFGPANEAWTVLTPMWRGNVAY